MGICYTNKNALLELTLNLKHKTYTQVFLSVCFPAYVSLYLTLSMTLLGLSNGLQSHVINIVYCLSELDWKLQEIPKRFWDPALKAKVLHWGFVTIQPFLQGCSQKERWEGLFVICHCHRISCCQFSSVVHKGHETNV